MPPVALSAVPPPASAPTTRRAIAAEKGRRGLGLLVALVVGSILGSGIFGLPQNMAAGPVPVRS